MFNCSGCAITAKNEQKLRKNRTNFCIRANWSNRELRTNSENLRKQTPNFEKKIRDFVFKFSKNLRFPVKNNKK